MAEEELGPLPAGRHGFSREQVAHNQRERLIAGLATAVAEKGYRAVTITDITKQARVSRRVFYENFEGKEECFLAAFEVVVGHIRELAAEAVAAIDDWPQRGDRRRPRGSRLLRRGARPRPPLPGRVAGRRPGRLGSLPRGGPRGRPLPGAGPRRARPASASCRPPPRSRRSAPSSCSPRRKVAAGEAEQLEELLPDFAEFILAPYLGAEEAARFARSQAA